MANNPWFDTWAKKAKEAGYPARSVYKLMEIQEAYRLVKKGDVVLDLGAAPGSWSKYLCKLVGKEGRVIGVDLQEVKISHPNFTFLLKDVFELTSQDFLALGIDKFDVIVSDMAPKTTGDKFVDHVRSVSLVEKALELVLIALKPSGHFVAKVFEGQKLPQLKKQIEKYFKGVKLFKPKSSRKESREMFIVAQHFKPKTDLRIDEDSTQL
ncbi:MULTISPECIES: RlmE family RNA methyltransferase [Thermodesulfobacterium]|jgi:23S rRNA (uridine2552-2'-O)-methyltransferase|uniref:Ribosomal RNA large subunit methyltransferase E n=1 Tax=Thermodesulfobacterium commune TaxID=1741 RepID=A0A101FIT8_9BACT|nr:MULTISPECIES: RlmE family RNA methyltransferase [Thermodesulfobacterium]KUJ97306.1 MAG: Ribosomal RNA large subunit methyltransferase E [Thermodesulfobacterium sp. 37_54]KUK19218.1 MAG: Ribosomal RNA large subunit methyltransferase E [Thermodesulfobacterium commune]KUK37816.1 MAG: Ribosomal RNA large subunit methyltransferase E [Thermodesulfobacterium commune]MBZ4681213.1 RlmE family methyltransferase [Thermodesulfobacterium sp.]MDK2861002.1 rRNA (uridine2552-2-O)-methyltransferase [Thermod